MAIEFTCAQCRQLVTTPDHTAGKQGKCPYCGTIMQIPARQDKRSQQPSPALPPQPPKISFSCPSCGKTLRAAPEVAGKKVRCPRCANVTRAPSISTAKADPLAISVTPLAKQQSGPIDFYCPRCLELVRTPASTAGKKGKCPHCQAVVPIPTESDTSVPGLVPLDEPQAKHTAPRWQDDLLEDLPPLPPPTTLGPSASPYSPPSPSEPAAPRKKARRKGRESVQVMVMIPAILLIVNHSLALVLSMVGIVYNLWQLHATGELQAMPSEDLQMAQTVLYVILGVAALLALGINIPIIAGAAQMARLENWGFSMTACVLALFSIVTCNPYCCLTGFIFGIWGIIVLSQQDVRRAFT